MVFNLMTDGVDAAMYRAGGTEVDDGGRDALFCHADGLVHDLLYAVSGSGYRSIREVLKVADYRMYKDKAEQKAAKRAQNILTEQLMDQMRADGQTDLLMMGAGPWKTASCMSAYCVDAQKMADAVHMKCWENDGKIRYFSLILFGQA